MLPALPDASWAGDCLELDALRQRGLTGTGVRLGHLDSGVDADHPALAGRVAAYRIFDRDGGLSASPLADSGNHGTRTAGLLCAGETQGIATGAAPGAELYTGQVLEGGQVLVRILMGMAWLLECGVQVACLPLGVGGGSTVFRSMIVALRQKGALPVAPVGNGGAGRALAPGSYSEVLSVGAIGADGRVPAFSASLNPPGSLRCLKPDLVAPGVKVFSTVPGGGLGAGSGTSLAAALVAGAACLLFQAHPWASAVEVEAALLATCRPLYSEQSHLWGRGLLRPAAALEFLDQAAANRRAFSGPELAPASNLSPPYFDPRLLRQLHAARGDSRLEAILVVREANPGDAADERGLAGRILDEVSRTMGETPCRTRFLPCARIGIVQATARYLRQLLSHEAVEVVSATEAGATPS